MSEQEDAGVGRCETTGCHRNAVVTYTFRDGKGGRVETDLCLPCRRVISLSSRIPWGDTSEEWHDRKALKEFREGFDER